MATTTPTDKPERVRRCPWAFKDGDGPTVRCDKQWGHPEGRHEGHQIPFTAAHDGAFTIPCGKAGQGSLGEMKLCELRHDHPGPHSFPEPRVAAVEDGPPAPAAIRPTHYGGADNPYETIKVLRAWSQHGAMWFCWGNAIKYLSRFHRKMAGDVMNTQDLSKAAQYAQWLLEIAEEIKHDLATDPR